MTRAKQDLNSHTKMLNKARKCYCCTDNIVVIQKISTTFVLIALQWAKLEKDIYCHIPTSK